MDADAPDPRNFISPDILATGQRMAQDAAQVALARQADRHEDPLLQAACEAAFLEGFVDRYTREFAQAALDERVRVAGIVQAPEARGREDEALRLAMETDLQPADAAFILATPQDALALHRPASDAQPDPVARIAASVGLTGRA